MTEKRLSKRGGSEREKGSGSPKTKKFFKEPKLTFIEPKLTKYGDVTSLTGMGFIGTGTPPIVG